MSKAPALQVGFPEDWKVRGPEADKVREMIKEAPAARKEANAPWYAALTDAQLAECDKDPQLFVVRFFTLRTGCAESPSGLRREW